MKHILCINSGSSSLKFSLFRMKKGAEEICLRGALDRIGLDRHFPDHAAALEELFRKLDQQKLPQPDAVGHRVVHGGSLYAAPAQVDAVLIAELKRLIPFAPLHQPAAIACIEAMSERDPKILQVACFDTAFHSTIPENAARYPLPRSLWDSGVRRYGFHGLSYEYVMSMLGENAPERIIIAHLGNGASMAAVLNGKCIDTTMGMTPTGGIMMGTRPGDLDPGILIHLLLNEKNEKMDISALDRMLNHESGLLGVSGISPDMKTLLDARRSNPRADQAIRMFCRIARKEISALAATLGGLDLLLFTGGIGERSAEIRAEICEGLEFLGITNASLGTCAVRVIPTHEDLMIARHVKSFMA